MNYRSFGRTAWQVGEIGYGMWGMAGWTGSEDRQSLESLSLAVESGVNFFDTAYAYGEGHSERLLGQIVRRHPQSRLYAATKIPPKNRQWPSRRGSQLDDVFPPDYIRLMTEKAWRTWAWIASTSSSSTSGKTPGQLTSDGNGPWTT